jgi:hypothetical protein
MARDDERVSSGEKVQLPDVAEVAAGGEVRAERVRDEPDRLNEPALLAARWHPDRELVADRARGGGRCRSLGELV